MATAADVLKMVKDNEVKFVDFRFTDTRGKEQHVSVPVKVFDMGKFDDGHAFDGSSIAGWKGIQASDMLLMPDPNSVRMDPFTDEPTLILTCDVVEPTDGKGYDRDPRSIAKRCRGVPEVDWPGRRRLLRPRAGVLHFRLGDLECRHVRLVGQSRVRRSAVVARTSSWRAATRVIVRRSRAAISRCRRSIRCRTSAPPCAWHWKSRASRWKCITTKWRRAGQCEIGTKYAPLVTRADWMQILKYTVHNVAHSYGKTATFMPKPIVGDNGSGMHVHQSVWKGGENLFAGNGYAGLSEFALYYIGGIIKHAKALNAITNPGTNSYKRLVPGVRGADQSGLLGAQPVGFHPHSLRVEPEGAPHRSALPGPHLQSRIWLSPPC